MTAQPTESDWAGWPIEAKRALLTRLRAEAALLPRPWHTQARPDQLPPPGQWAVWAVISGRGFGKTRLGAEWIAEQAATQPGTIWAVIAPTWRDVRTICFEGPSGILHALQPGERAAWNASALQLTLTNESKIFGYGAEKPDRLRGTNLSGAWFDELAAAPRAEALWTEALIPALRIGERPRVLITTTPRPVPLLKELLARDDGSVAVVRGSTFDNRANLSPAALAEMERRYAGTRIGRQELYGELLDDVEGALWTIDMIAAAAWDRPLPEFTQTVTAVDPSGSENGDATGIITAGVNSDGVMFVLDDDTTKGSPGNRFAAACLAAHRHGAGTLICESNYGGDISIYSLRQAWKHLAAERRVSGPCPRIIPTASRGSKADRAMPVVGLYEQGRVFHTRPFPDLEDELTTWTPDAQWSPNRMDSLVFAARHLLPGFGTSSVVTATGRGRDPLGVSSLTRARIAR